ncbi:hypothetical protein PILCRDRAFT_725819 [Piloderma croceum F 1598]|uniref:Uncharacterized protein n=1 Tax=Piloderma croceum (strain F 1598) TaxID=765440 RepID=A0A0C3F0U7_PILCF|nr:hypothetical protein PILCRDRAFT_725819 [Piloderma croceum F 1598]
MHGTATHLRIDLSLSTRPLRSFPRTFVGNVLISTTVSPSSVISVIPLFITSLRICVSGFSVSLVYHRQIAAESFIPLYIPNAVLNLPVNIVDLIALRALPNLYTYPRPHHHGELHKR